MALTAVSMFAVPGNNHHGQEGEFVVEFFQDFQALFVPVHPDVQEHQVGQGFLDGFDTLGAVGRLFDFEALVPQYSAQGLADVLLVVDDQNGIVHVLTFLSF